MTERPEPARIPDWAGACATCGHARAVASTRGSIYVLCERSRTDPRFRRYPMLPVTRCPGYAGEPAGA